MPTAHTPTYLSNLHPHERDVYISFQEEGHIYTVHGETDYTSVTTFVHDQFPHFDSEEILEKILHSPKYHSDPSYKYYQRSKEDILHEWEQNRDHAAILGTQMHYHIELFYNQYEVQDDSIEYQYFLNFVHDFPELKAYRTEYLIYHEELKISGSVDMVFQNPNGTYSIGDWKRCKSIEHESFGNKCALTECIQHLPDTNFFHYSLQLSVYKYILETKYNMKIQDLFLIVLHPDHPYKTYEKKEVEYLEKEVLDLFALRQQTLITKYSLPLLEQTKRDTEGAERGSKALAPELKDLPGATQKEDTKISKTKTSSSSIYIPNKKQRAIMATQHVIKETSY